MDRIREAITRARDAKTRNAPAPGGVQAAQSSGLQPPPPPSSPPRSSGLHASDPHPASPNAGAPDGQGFTPVACNFDEFRKHRIISNEQDPVLNAYRVLRTRVIQKMAENGWRTLAVVSPSAGAGKTVTALNLAIAIGSKEDTRVTLVDLDFYRPSMARYLGLQEFPSILDYFEDKRSLQEVTLEPDLNNVLLIANERVTRRGAEHLTSHRMDALIETTVAQYASDIVIFDMSPILGCDDTIAFLPKVDCALLVAASGQTRAEELKEAKRLISNGANLLGAVLNKAPAAFLPNQYY